MNEEINDFIIYKAHNTINDFVYIGATTNSIHQRELDHVERANRGETSIFHDAIKTYGADAFTWEQVDTALSTDDLAQKEKKYIIQYNSKEYGYNSDCGGGFKKSVYQYDLDDGSLIATFNCLQDAGNVINATKQNISSACLSVNNLYKGYYWSYICHEPFTPNNDKRKKEVVQLDLEGNIILNFKSVAEASRQLGINKTCISKVCRGEQDKTQGLIFRYK